MTFPWGLDVTVQSVGSLKHTWSNKFMADTLSAYTRGSTFTVEDTPSPITTVTWYQAWDTSGNGSFVFSLTITHILNGYAEINSMHFLLQLDYSSDGEVCRLQITEAPEILSIVTTPKPASIHLSYTCTGLALPMCGSGICSKHTHQRMIRKASNLYTMFTLVDVAGGVMLYQLVNVTVIIWFDGTPKDVSGGSGVVDVYHR